MQKKIEIKNELPLYIIKKVIEDYLLEINLKDIPVNFSMPSYTQHGDLTTNIAIRIAKELNKNPKEIGNEISEFIKEKTGYLIQDIQIAGPGLINIFLSPNANKILIENIINGSNDNFKINNEQDKLWVIEHTSPNPNKAMHLGHLRNNLVGMSLANLIKQCGGNVKLDAVDNNRGIAIAKAMYGFLSSMNKNSNGNEIIETKEWIDNKNSWYTPEEKQIRPDVFVTMCYVAGEEEFQKDKKVEEIVRNMVLLWEDKDKDTWELWKHILNYSYAGMNMTLERLGSHWDKVWHESDHYQSGKDYVNNGLKKGIFKELEDGAILTQIEEPYNIPETILLKNDGTALYITQDIALTDLKKKFYNADKLIWVIGPDQSLAMKQLFAVCEQLGIGKISDFIHTPYGYMGLKDEEGNFKKMSSRAGTVLLIDDLLDLVKEKIKSSQEERSKSKHNESTSSESNEIIVNNEDNEILREKLALAATKFSILKCDRGLNIAFDVDESISINGDSGIYVMYTYVRIKSILKEALNRGVDLNNITDSITGSIAPELMRVIHSYPLILNSAHMHLSTHPIAHYLLSLCSEFNKFYGQEKILDDGPNMPEKIAILNTVAKTIKQGLHVLNIETVDKM